MDLIDKRTPWPFKTMTAPASSPQYAQPLAKRVSQRHLTEDEKNRIVELHEQGMTNADIGREIGCTDVAVGYVLKKRRIAHQQQDADAGTPELAETVIHEEISQELGGSASEPPELKKLLNMGSKSALVIDYLKVSMEISELLGRKEIHLSRSAVGVLVEILDGHDAG